jgi:hypothetical protein
LKKLKRIFYSMVGAGALVAHIAMSGGYIALARTLRFWAYPTFFGLGMLLSGLVLIVLVPPKHKQEAAFPWLRKLVTLDERRFDKGIWPWLRQRGAFVLVLGATIILGPLIGAFAIRVLGLREQKAWLYAFVTNLISVSIWVSIYIGVFDWIKSMLASVFAAS